MIGKAKLLKTIATGDKNLLYREIKKIFAIDQLGTPTETNGEILYYSWKILEKEFPHEILQELLYKRFLHNNSTRYAEYAEKDMVSINGGVIRLGDDYVDKYLGERTKEVSLSPYYINKYVVSNKLYSQYDPFHKFENENLPVTNITWYDAVMFSLWLDCRLPTEAEWECACKGQSKLPWCVEENRLYKYAWYSENSNGFIHEIGKLKPNDYGLFDVHGNVWEWCLDGYEEDYFLKTSDNNPCNDKKGLEKICKGGSIHAFSEMCRCSFRFSEPPDFKAIDIGFRISKSQHKFNI